MTTQSVLIHPSSVIEEGAKFGKNVKIGPFCVVGAGVQLLDDVELISHAVILGNTVIGSKTVVHPFASIGNMPQDLKYHGENSRLIVGKNNVIRENVTMNPGTEGGGMVTTIGDDCLFMAGAHVAHDCEIGNHVIFANNATIAGHCMIGDYVVLGGLSAVHQFVRIGKHAFIGGMSGIGNDVIPFAIALGNRAHLGGLNVVGMKRSGFDHKQIHIIRDAYRLLFAEEGTIQERKQQLAELYEGNADIEEILNFLDQGTQRSLCTPPLSRTV